MWIVIVGAIAFIIWLISAIIKNYSSENQALIAKCKNLEKLNELNEKNITELKKDFEKLSTEKQQTVKLQNELQKEKIEIENKRKELLDKYYEEKNTLASRLKDYEKNFLVEKSQSQKWLAGMITDFLILPIDHEIEKLNDSYSQKNGTEQLR